MALEWKARKDPDDKKDYQLDWSRRLSEVETLTSSSWSVPSGLVSSSEAFTDKTSTIWLQGGVADEQYRLTNHVTTSEGREYDQSVLLNCVEC
ncbi:hypothetical protein ACQU0X_01070 [Pseudovibrio ascidiaceicola]|uniref:phage fiber-tail adaptor protein n=1 Tax=Pseudovibrio ascidiaceicola TaxID=285279 RepID=UPI003D36BC7C